MNDKTRSYNEIAAENEELHEKLRDTKVKLGLANIVNRDLQKEKQSRLDDKYLENKEETAFGEYMFTTGFECGKQHNRTTNYYGDKFETAIEHAIEAWKAQKKTKETAE